MGLGQRGPLGHRVALLERPAGVADRGPQAREDAGHGAEPLREILREAGVLPEREDLLAGHGSADEGPDRGPPARERLGASGQLALLLAQAAEAL